MSKKERILKAKTYHSQEEFEFTNQTPNTNVYTMLEWVNQLELVSFTFPDTNRYGESYPGIWYLDQHGKLIITGKGVYSKKLKQWIAPGEYGYHDIPQGYQVKVGLGFDDKIEKVEDRRDINFHLPLVQQPHTLHHSTGNDVVFNHKGDYELPYYFPTLNGTTVPEYPNLTTRFFVMGNPISISETIDKCQQLFVVSNQEGHLKPTYQDMHDKANKLPALIDGGKLNFGPQSNTLYIYPDGSYRGRVSIEQPYSFDGKMVGGWQRDIGVYLNPGLNTVKALPKYGYKKLLTLGGQYGLDRNRVRIIHGRDYQHVKLNKAKTGAEIAPIAPLLDDEGKTESEIKIVLWLNGNFQTRVLHSYLIQTPWFNLVDKDFKEQYGLNRTSDRPLIPGNETRQQHIVLRSPTVQFQYPIRMKQAINTNDQYGAYVEQFHRYSHIRDEMQLVDTRAVNPFNFDRDTDVLDNRVFSNIRLFEEQSVFENIYPSGQQIKQPYLGRDALEKVIASVSMQFKRHAEVFDYVEPETRAVLFSDTHTGPDWPGGTSKAEFNFPKLNGQVNPSDRRRPLVNEYPLTLDVQVGKDGFGYYPAMVESWGPVEEKLNVPTVTVDSINLRYYKMREAPFYWSHSTGASFVQALSTEEACNNSKVGARELTRAYTATIMGNTLTFAKGDVVFPESIYPAHLRGDCAYPQPGEAVEHPRIGYFDHLWYHHDRKHVKDNPDMLNFYPVICVNQGRIEEGVTKGDVLLYNWADNEYYKVPENTHITVFNYGNLGNFIGFEEAVRNRLFVETNKVKPLLFNVKKRLSRYHFPLRATLPDGGWARHDASLFRVWFKFDWDGVSIRSLETLDMADNFMIEDYMGDYMPEPMEVDHVGGRAYTLRLPAKEGLMAIRSLGHYLYFTPKTKGKEIIFRPRTITHHRGEEGDNRIYHVELPFHYPSEEWNEVASEHALHHDEINGILQAHTVSPIKTWGDKPVSTKRTSHFGRVFNYIDNWAYPPKLPPRTQLAYEHQSRLPANAVYDWREGVYKLNNEVISEVGIRTQGQLNWLVDIGEQRNYNDTKGKTFNFSDVIDDGIGIEYGYIDYDKDKRNSLHRFSKTYRLDELRRVLGKHPTFNLAQEGNAATLMASALFGEAYTTYFKLNELIWWRDPAKSNQLFGKDEASYYFSREEGLPEGVIHHRVFYIEVPVLLERISNREVYWRIERQRMTFTLNFKIKFKLTAVRLDKHPMNLGFLHDPTRFSIYFSTPTYPYTDFKDHEEFKTLVLDRMNVSYNGHNHSEVVEGLAHRSSLGDMDAGARGLEPHEKNITREYNVNSAGDVPDEERQAWHLRINTEIPVRTATVTWPTVYAANRKHRVTELQRDYQIPSHVPAVGSKYWHRSFLIDIKGRRTDGPNYLNMFERRAEKEDPRSPHPEGNAFIYGESEIVKTGLRVEFSPTAVSSIRFFLTDCLDERVARDLVTLNLRFELSARQANEVLCFRTNAMDYYQMFNMSHQDRNMNLLLGNIGYSSNNDYRDRLVTYMSIARSPFIWMKQNEISFIEGNAGSRLFTDSLREGFLREGEKPTLDGNFYITADGSKRQPSRLLNTAFWAESEITEEEYNQHRYRAQPSPGDGIKRALKVEAWLSAKPLDRTSPLWSWREVQNDTSFNHWGERNKVVKYFRLTDG